MEVVAFFYYIIVSKAQTGLTLIISGIRVWKKSKLIKA